MGHLLTILQKKKVIVQDSFNRADNALTLGNADTGQTWGVTPNAWGISGNQAYSVDTTTTDYASITGTINPFKMSATLKFSSYEGIMLRFSDTNNHIFARIGSSDITLQKRVAGASTTIGTYTFSPVVGNSYLVQAICNGSNIRIILDGIERINVTETFNQSAIKVGIKVFASAAGRFDNFLLEEL
jgi:hypothetical protein